MADIDALVAELRAGLEGVTPGPWKAEQDPDVLRPDIDRPYVTGPSEIVVGNDGICMPDQLNDRSFVEDAANMRHIARCFPENISALLDALEAERSARVRLEEALLEAEETLRLAERPAFPDPVYHDEVKRLGRRIGFGALMSTASAGWREVLQEQGDPVGGEFVAGPCHGTVVYALRIIRSALSHSSSKGESRE